MRMLSRLLILLLPMAVVSVNPQSRDLRIINESGFKVMIYWINRWKNDELVLNSEEGIFHGAESKINSYVTHEFEIQEVPAKKTGLCRGPNNTCRKGYMQVNENEEQLIIFKDELRTIIHTDNKSRARDQAKAVLEECKANAVKNFNAADPEGSMKEMLACIDKSVDTAVASKKDEIEFQQNLRHTLGGKLVNYACVDPNVTMTESIENKTWSYLKHTYPVQVLLDRPTSKITHLAGFISDEECAAIEARITFKDIRGDNGLYAKKGGVDIDWKASNSDPTLDVAKRMYAYSADVLRTNLPPDGAEQMFMLHYPGDAENPSRYDPHCDGACDGSLHTKGERIATVIAYCETAKTGGHTHFNNAGIHIIPQKGSAVFYSYWDHVSDMHDSGYTQHAGCGVVDGDKKIVTHKIRV